MAALALMEIDLNCIDADFRNFFILSEKIESLLHHLKKKKKIQILS